MPALPLRRWPLRGLTAAFIILQLITPLSFAQSTAATPAPALSAAERVTAADVKADTIRNVTTALTAKDMEGRGTGQPGADRAARYIADQFAKAGLKPLGDTAEGKPSYLQAIKFKADQVQPDTTFKAGDVGLKYRDEFIISPPLPQDASKEVSGGLVFAGYGVVSPDLKRDDLAGIDVKGKIVVLLRGKPANADAAAWAKATTQQALFGRLIGAGAAGFAVVYVPARETQPFRMAAAYLTRRRVSPADAPAMPFKVPPIALINDAGAEKLFAGTGASFADVKAKAQSGEAVSRDLNKPATLFVHTKHEEVPSSNVVGVLEGSDPKLKEEAVVFSAHYDAYGIDTDGTIYPGAADNAVGVGKLVAIAEAFAKAKTKPRRSIIFLAVTGEEYGLLGAEAWVKHPTWPLEKIAADINYDGIGTEVWGELHYVVDYGEQHSELGKTVADIVTAMGGEISPDPFPEEGVFYRSDHYAFVKRGIPSISPISSPAGDQVAFGQRVSKWLVTDYHMPTDTIQKDWNWKGAQQLAVLGLLTGMRVANQDAMPTWLPTSPYNRPRGTTLPPPMQ